MITKKCHTCKMQNGGIFNLYVRTTPEWKRWCRFHRTEKECGSFGILFSTSGWQMLAWKRLSTPFISTVICLKMCSCAHVCSAVFINVLAHVCVCVELCHAWLVLILPGVGLPCRRRVYMEGMQAAHHRDWPFRLTEALCMCVCVWGCEGVLRRV